MFKKITYLLSIVFFSSIFLLNAGDFSTTSIHQLSQMEERDIKSQKIHADEIMQADKWYAKYLEKESALDYSSLHLYKFFQLVESGMNEALNLINVVEKNQKESLDQGVQEKLKQEWIKIHKDKDLIVYIKALFVNIVNNLNKGEFPELRIKFSNFSHYFSEESLEEVPTLRCLRAFKKTLIKFDSYVRSQHSKKNYFKNSDLIIYDQLIEFNLLVLKNLESWKNYLRVSLSDKIADFLFFRPCEWASDNPILATLIATAIVAGVSYFYIWPKIRMLGLANKNKNLDVEQHEALGQVGAECSIHALFNAWKMSQAKNKDELGKMLNDAQEFAQFRQQCIKIRGKKGINWLEGGELADLARQLKIEIPRVIIAYDMQKLLPGHIDGLQSGGDIPAHLVIQAYQDGSNREPLYFIINDGSRANTNYETRGHWVAYKFSHNDSGKYKHNMQVDAANSLYGNITDHPAVNRIFNILRG